VRAKPGTFLIGWDSQDITPEKPVELIGQYYQRISRRVRDPLSVTALAMEQQTAAGTQAAVMVSGDMVFVTRELQDEVRRCIGQRAPGLDPRMVFLNATHIHSGPSCYAPFRWWKPARRAVQPEEIRALWREAMASAVVNAWNARRPAGISDARAYAAAGFCRRTLHADGRAVMYGDPSRADFIGMEAGHDHAVQMLFTWNDSRKLTGVVVNVPCPCQVMESRCVVSADFFGEFRARIRKAHGRGVHVLCQVSAAGDQSPRDLPNQAHDDINYWDESGMLAVAGRLEQAVADGYASARRRIELAPILKHAVTDLALPVRRAGKAEYRAACAEVKRLTAGRGGMDATSRRLYAQFVRDVRTGEKTKRHGPFDNKELEFVQLENAQAVIARFKAQDDAPTFTVELHAVRVGDCAFVTNPFELYLDYGLMIQARSRAKRTFVVQLTGDSAGYLPTARAVAGGGYGALIINGHVGPDGGRALVEASVRAIEGLWDE
jgi:hypothetical protein